LVFLYSFFNIVSFYRELTNSFSLTKPYPTLPNQTLPHLTEPYLTSPYRTAPDLTLIILMNDYDGDK